MISPLNPPVRLSATPSNACLPEKDGREFSALLQCGRLAVNSIGDMYPNLTDPNRLVSAYSSQRGRIVLSHLSAAMYSYWDAAPAGPSAHHLTAEHLREPLRQVCRRESSAWGTHRLNAPAGSSLFVLADTPAGSIIADPSMTRFYKVLGLMRSPATTLTQMGITLPAAARLTALPFRGVLVYDGILAGTGTMPRTLDAAKAETLRTRYAQAEKQGRVITGFHVDPQPSPLPGAASRESTGRALADLSAEEKKQVAEMKAMRKVNTMMIFRRFGYTEEENPNHIVLMMNGATPCGSLISTALVPSASEVLRELVKFAKSSGTLPEAVAVDDKATAIAVNDVTKYAGIHTDLYPIPSVEEQVLLTSFPPGILESLKNFDGSS